MLGRSYHLDPISGLNRGATLYPSRFFSGSLAPWHVCSSPGSCAEGCAACGSDGPGPSSPIRVRATPRLAADWSRHGHGYHTLQAITPAHQAALLKVRAAGLGLLMAASSGTRRPVALIEDTAVDPARLPAYVERFTKVLERHGLTAGFYGHASVGCLHIRPFMDLTNPS